MFATTRLRLDTNVLDAVNANLRQSPDCKGFPEAILEASDFFRTLPEKYSLRFHIKPIPQLMGASRSEAFSNALKEIHGWLGFFIFSTAYKAQELLWGLVTGLNMRFYTLAILAGRSLLEHAATLNSSVPTLENEVARLEKLDLLSLRAVDLRSENLKIHAQTIWDSWSAVRLMAVKGRFQWELAVARDQRLFKEYRNAPASREQTNILTLIDRLRFDGPAPREARPRFWYEMLSDFVHPNVASYVLTIDNTREAGPNAMTYSLAARPSEKSNLTQSVVNVISIPIRDSLRILVGRSRSLIDLRNRYEQHLRKLGIVLSK